MDGGTLVANVDDRDAHSVDLHPERHDMPTAEREDPFYAALLERPRNERRDAFASGCDPRC
jgi:hypothetical protein